MDESLNTRVFSKIIFAIFVVAIVDLFYINWWILNDDKKRANSSESPMRELVEHDTVPFSSPVIIESPEPSPVIKASPAASVPTKNSATVAEDRVVVQTAEKEIFIPLGSGYSTSSSYADITNLEVTIDSRKYPSIDGVYFEAAIYVEGGNGAASAQIYNVDDKTSYIESRITNNSATPTVKSSGKIPFASGSKTYRVQAKNEFGEYKAHIDNARLKVVLK